MAEFAAQHGLNLSPQGSKARVERDRARIARAEALLAWGLYDLLTLRPAAFHGQEGQKREADLYQLVVTFQHALQRQAAENPNPSHQELERARDTAIAEDRTADAVRLNQEAWMLKHGLPWATLERETHELSERYERVEGELRKVPRTDTERKVELKESRARLKQQYQARCEDIEKLQQGGIGAPAWAPVLLAVLAEYLRGRLAERTYKRLPRQYQKMERPLLRARLCELIEDVGHNLSPRLGAGEVYKIAECLLREVEHPAQAKASRIKKECSEVRRLLEGKDVEDFNFSNDPGIKAIEEAGLMLASTALWPMPGMSEGFYLPDFTFHDIKSLRPKR